MNHKDFRNLDIDIVPAIKYFSKWEKYDMLRA